MNVRGSKVESDFRFCRKKRKLNNDFSEDPAKFKLHLFDNAMLQPVSHFTQEGMQHVFELHRHKKIIAHQMH